jgi:hypothetical protein
VRDQARGKAQVTPDLENRIAHPYGQAIPRVLQWRKEKLTRIATASRHKNPRGEPKENMKNILTFVIPVRHQDSVKNWQRIKKHLSETITSIASQDQDGWKGVIVANHGAELPDLPQGFEVKRVDFPPNQIPEVGSVPNEVIYEATRIDKGRRILAGMLHAGEMGHVMIVDNDDFVSRQLTSFVAARPQSNGWYFRDGYVWGDGGKILFLFPDFSHLCGTSHIVRADLYQLPSSFEVADETYIKRMLGSHLFLHDHLNATGNPLEPLPFTGAIYRTNHPESNSHSGGTLTKYFFRKQMLTNPTVLYSRVRRLHLKTRRIEREFMGASASSS